MIALDTNLLVRLFTRDDPAQFDAVLRMVRTLSSENPGFVSREALVELVWVLKARYGKSGEEIAAVLGDLVGMENLVLEAEAEVAGLLEPLRQGAGFADLMILAAARRAGCRAVHTFDRKFARENGVTLLETS